MVSVALKTFMSFDIPKTFLAAVTIKSTLSSKISLITGEKVILPFPVLAALYLPLFKFSFKGCLS